MKKVSKTLTEHLERVTELASRLERGDRKASRIDIDILLDALRQMYDDVYALTDENEDESGKRKAESEEQPAEMSVLMVDNEVEAVFANDTEAVAGADPANSQPTIEEIEGQPNDELFEEAEPEAEAESGERKAESGKRKAESEEAVEEPVVAPVAEPVEKPVEKAEPQPAEEPKTLWDKLQSTQGSATIADKIGAAKSISDLLEEKKAKTEEPKAESEEPKAESEEPKAESGKRKAESEEVKPEMPPQGADRKSQAPESNAAAAPSLFDYFKTPAQDNNTQRTLADTLGGQMRQHAVRTDKVHDLRTVININDKFSFMSELFHNNMKGYNDFILRLNAIDGRDEALAYVGTIAEQYSWDNESLAVKTFYSIFDRKF